MAGHELVADFVEGMTVDEEIHPSIIHRPRGFAIYPRRHVVDAYETNPRTPRLHVHSAFRVFHVQGAMSHRFCGGEAKYVLHTLCKKSPISWGRRKQRKAGRRVQFYENCKSMY